MDFTDSHLFDSTTLWEFNWFEFREELQELPNVCLATQLIAKIRSLHQKLAVLCDHSGVHEACTNLRNLVEDKIVLHMSWTILMNFCIVE